MTKFKFNILKITVVSIFLTFTLPMAVSATTVSRQPAPFPVGMDTWYGSIYNTEAVHDDKLVVGNKGVVDRS